MPHAVAYKDMDFVWVSDHWDFHRGGICRYNGELARFSCTEDYPDDYGTYGEDCEGCPRCDYVVSCKIYPLTTAEKMRWVWSKKVFELLVGFHWTYLHRPQGVRFSDRKPNWLRGWLRTAYYAPQRGRRRRARS